MVLFERANGFCQIAICHNFFPKYMSSGPHSSKIDGFLGTHGTRANGATAFDITAIQGLVFKGVIDLRSKRHSDPHKDEHLAPQQKRRSVEHGGHGTGRLCRVAYLPGQAEGERHAVGRFQLQRWHQ